MLYYIFVGLVYACILAILLLALIFGRRARRNVKKERITSLEEGFSPLDVQRIFIGKTYPRRLTKALIVHWAQMGYIRVKYVNKTHVRLILVRKPSTDESKRAIFFDRGTYVRERDLFNRVFTPKLREKIVNINLPLFKKSAVKEVNSGYAVREDEGVYSPKHYTLKIITFALSVIPFFLAGIYVAASYQDGGNVVGIIPPLMMFLGMYVFRFMLDIPFLFRLVWSSAWVLGGVGVLGGCYETMSDPLCIYWASVVILFLGTFLLVRFVDYREKNNLADYSDLINYRKYLLFTSKARLLEEDYYAALPFLYAFNIKFLVKRKFNTAKLPEWYESESGERGALL